MASPVTPSDDAIAWPNAVSRLVREARADVDEIIATGQMSRAARLAQLSGVSFDPTYFPMYFTGAFEARLVLVHLNPALSSRLSAPMYPSFDQYLDAHRRFGYYHWDCDPHYRSAFDQKQVRFLRPFGAIDFVPESEPGSNRKNAALAIDAKLQLELVPYASPSFPTHRLPADVLQPHFDRVLGVVGAYPRDYVLFCGAVFDDLLQRTGRVTSRQEHRFRLPIAAGTSKSKYRFSNVVLEWEGGAMRAGVCRSFAIQGLPMAAYGKRCFDLYGT